MGIIVICSCKNESKYTVNSNNPEHINVNNNENMAGGWSEVAVENDVNDALDFALEEIRPNAALKNVISAKKQVVKGLNYDLSFTLESGETWNVIVHRDPKGTYSLTKKSKMPIPGGWSETEITNEVEDAVTFVLSRMNNASPLKEILSAKSQVVRGVNYEVTFSLENNSIWTARVNRDLDKKFTILQEAEHK